MKTYSTHTNTSRLAAYLTATCHPFHFDGETIEFDASNEFVAEMKNTDSVLATIHFRIHE